jgi:hypothetical protein
MSTYLFLINNYSLYSGLDYVNKEDILSIGNRLGLPDNILKHIESSFKSLLNGVPELNYIWSLF